MKFKEEKVIDPFVLHLALSFLPIYGEDMVYIENAEILLEHLYWRKSFRRCT